MSAKPEPQAWAQWVTWLQQTYVARQAEPSAAPPVSAAELAQSWQDHFQQPVTLYWQVDQAAPSRIILSPTGLVSEPVLESPSASESTALRLWVHWELGLAAADVDGETVPTAMPSTEPSSCAILSATSTLPDLSAANPWRPATVVHGVLACLPATGPLALERVQAAALVSTDLPAALWAVRHEGCWYRQRRQMVQDTVTAVAEAVVSLAWDRYHPPATLMALCGGCRAIRSQSAAAVALAGLASGRLDAHLDFRGRQWPAPVLAGGLLVQEAGGMLLRPDGTPLTAIGSPRQRVNFLAACNQTLAQALLRLLRR